MSTLMVSYLTVWADLTSSLDNVRGMLCGTEAYKLLDAFGLRLYGKIASKVA